MRPIDRGSAPKKFREYKDARGDLIDRLGEYCSYCEMHLDASLAVEHVQPQSSSPHLTLVWDNFLLGCTNCNSTKKDKQITLNYYYWPDRDNTFRAFEYCQGGIVRVSGSLTATEQQCAQNTLELTGLDRTPKNNPSASNRRWLNRREAWDIAERAMKNLTKNNTSEMREQIIETAKAKGFWSVWMTVFRDDRDMLDRLIKAFPGTCQSCFNSQCQPVPRPGGAL
ncbi:MAG: hypothetical protein Fur0025_28750 [Oscillatoriaceae cyanobacterium]